MRLSRSPTVLTLLAFLVVFALQTVLSVVPGLSLGVALFALQPPITARPWTVVTSVYAHAGVGHLLSNAIALAVVGFPLERLTTRLRFHLFFVLTGAIAGLAQIWISGLFSPSASAVLGASGAVFALIGYVLTSNRVAGGLFDVLDFPFEAQLLVFAILAVVVTVATGAPGVALIAHFTGLLLGLVCGRARVLAVDDEPEPSGTDDVHGW